MKLTFFIIAALICIPGIAQVEVNTDVEKYNERAALCKTRIIEDAELRYSPMISDNTNIILPKGTKVYVFFGENSYWFIRTNVYEGYVNERRLRITNKMRWVKQNAYNSKAQEEPKPKSVWRGMSKISVLQNLGEPEKIEVYFYAYGRDGGTSELWIYADRSLSFRNGILEKINIKGKYYSYH